MSTGEQKQVEVENTGNAENTAPSQNNGNSEKTNGDGKNNANIDRSEKPIMVARNKSGVVKWFSFKNGYGFITVDGDGDDIFVHRSEFIREGAREVFYHIDVGDRLEFDIINRAKGREAVAVTGPNGVRIPGSPANFGRRRRHTNSERVPRNTQSDEHYEDARDALDQPNNGESKKRGGRGGRRRNASGEGQDQQGNNENGDGQKGGRRRPRKNTGSRRGPKSDGEDNGSNQQENAASNQ